MSASSSRRYLEPNQRERAMCMFDGEVAVCQTHERRCEERTTETYLTYCVYEKSQLRRLLLPNLLLHSLSLEAKIADPFFMFFFMGRHSGFGGTAFLSVTSATTTTTTAHQ